MTETKLLGGEVVLDGTNPTPIVTGLRRITAVALTCGGAAAPGDGTAVLTYDVVGPTVNAGGPRHFSVRSAPLCAPRGSPAQR